MIVVCGRTTNLKRKGTSNKRSKGTFVIKQVVEATPVNPS